MSDKWHEYFFTVASAAATNSSCTRRTVGAIVVKNKDILSTGYNGTPRGIINCNKGGCPRGVSNSAKPGHNYEDSLCVHAEENALLRAGRLAEGAIMYCTLCPCLMCARLIINSGVKQVYFSNDYEGSDKAKSLLRGGGVRVDYL